MSGNKGSSNTVSVACKLPNGLILQLYKMETRSEATMMGFRDVKVAVPVGERITLNGNAVHVDRAPKHEIMNGFGITRNVPAEFFTQWLKDNHDMKAVREGMIFACDSNGRMADESRDKQSIRTGLEPLDTSKPVVPGVRTADEHRKAA